MRKIIIALTVIAAALLLPGCSHNTGAFTLGTRVNLGIDPQNATANLSYTDGLNVVDVSRMSKSMPTTAFRSTTAPEPSKA